MKSVKLFPCVRGCDKITRLVTVAPGQSMSFEVYKCYKCGLTANLSGINRQARLNWNKMIGGEMKDAVD